MFVDVPPTLVGHGGVKCVEKERRAPAMGVREVSLFFAL